MQKRKPLYAWAVTYAGVIMWVHENRRKARKFARGLNSKCPTRAKVLRIKITTVYED